jgi:hypothetical protein
MKYLRLSNLSRIFWGGYSFGNWKVKEHGMDICHGASCFSSHRVRKNDKKEIEREREANRPTPFVTNPLP